MSTASKFKEVTEKFKEKVELKGGNLIVRKIEIEAKSKTGIVMSSGASSQINSIKAHMPVFAEVLIVGKGYEDGEVEVDAGDIILVGQNDIQAISQFGNMSLRSDIPLGVTHEANVLMQFKGQEAFDEYFSSLQASLES